MLFRILKKKEFRKLIDIMMESNEVIGPKQVSVDAKGRPIHQYLPIESFQDIDLDYETTAYSAKTYFLPYQENLSTFQFDDQDWTQKISYRFQEPQRGEIVVFESPVNNNFDYIKRIVALPGETVGIENGQIFINGQKLEESYLPVDLFTREGLVFDDGQTLTLGADQYLVMGDNRPHSSDSRDWGPVPRQNIVGKAWLRYWPLSKFETIKN